MPLETRISGEATEAQAPFVPTTEAERAEMLRAIGVSSIDDLLRSVPPEILRPPLKLPPGMTEMELFRHLEKLGEKNLLPLSFLGAGAYDRFIPAAVWPLALRGEFLTAYTPYQAEASQGTLQAIYEFQTAVSELMGLPVANASLYDGASSLAEAVNAAFRQTGRTKAVLSQAVHPHYRQTVRTYFGSHPEYAIIEIPCKADGTTDVAALEAAAGDAACVAVQNPNFFGILEDVDAAVRAAHGKGALFVSVVEPVTLGILKSPGESGADIAVGDGQGFGIPPSFGGPTVGLYAATTALLRTVPGRLCGRTVDKEGKSGFVLTLQAREQHIRREKAASNICSNQALMALAATIHLSLLGPKGLEEVCRLSYRNAHRLAELLSGTPGYRLRFGAPFFQEFVLDCPKEARSVQEALLEKGILGGLPLGEFYPGMEGALLVCATETKTDAELEAFASALRGL